MGRNGENIQYQYDAMNRMTQETVQTYSTTYVNTYDKVGRLLTSSYNNGTFAYQYNTAGEQTKTTRPDGLILQYQYDNDGDTAGITYPDGYLYSYGYDELDRMTAS